MYLLSERKWSMRQSPEVDVSLCLIMEKQKLKSDTGVTGAKAGTLSILVGGTEESFTRAKPFLEFMGKRIIHCGPSGSGLVTKICNNLVLGVQQVVVAEAMLLGQKLGVQPRILADVINNATGACWASSVNNPVPGALEGGSARCEYDFEGGFATALMLKVSSRCHDTKKARNANKHKFISEMSWSIGHGTRNG